MNKMNTHKSVKRDRFIRVVERRVGKVIDSIESLGKCANRSNYEYTEEDVKKIFGEIGNKLKEIRAPFVSSKDKKKFRLE
jgi:hypothetical protein